MEGKMKETYEEFNPKLQPKSHDLILSYWLPKGKNPDYDFEEAMEAVLEYEGFERCGSGYSFAERRRDLEFKRQE